MLPQSLAAMGARHAHRGSDGRDGDTGYRYRGRAERDAGQYGQCRRQANGDSAKPPLVLPGWDSRGVSEVDVSADGRYVVFSSSASNLVPGDTNGADDVFVKD